jgi:hypothetical protein
VQTDWQEFKELSPEDFKNHMKTPIVIDGRRIFDNPQDFIEAGVTYRGIGWKNEGE